MCVSKSATAAKWVEEGKRETELGQREGILGDQKLPRNSCERSGCMFCGSVRQSAEGNMSRKGKRLEFRLGQYWEANEGRKGSCERLKVMVCRSVRQSVLENVSREEKCGRERKPKWDNAGVSVGEGVKERVREEDGGRCDERKCVKVAKQSLTGHYTLRHYKFHPQAPASFPSLPPDFLTSA